MRHNYHKRVRLLLQLHHNRSFGFLTNIMTKFISERLTLHQQVLNYKPLCFASFDGAGAKGPRLKQFVSTKFKPHSHFLPSLKLTNSICKQSVPSDKNKLTSEY